MRVQVFAFALLAFGIVLANAPADDEKPKTAKTADGEKKADPKKADGTKKGPQIGHMVFFKLKESTPANRKKLVADCRKYLTDHEGTVHFSAGVIGEQFKSEVNDREFDVALHVVFANKAAHDVYQDHPRHLDFIKDNKDTWEKVRVFDSEVQTYFKKAAPKAPGEGDKTGVKKGEGDKPGVKKGEGDKPGVKKPETEKKK